jgi:hypothetical protein
MRLTGALIAVAVAVAAFACGSSPTGPSGSNGTLRLMITDSPFSDARAVLITFSSVAAHRSGTGEESEGGWSQLTFADAASTRTCDLKKLVDAQDVLGVGPLAAGHYTQLRLHVSSATLYFENPSEGPACAASVPVPAGRSARVDIPSGEVRLNREFDVPEGGATSILLDFDGDRSINQMGNGGYRMTPVIGIVSVS